MDHKNINNNNINDYNILLHIISSKVSTFVYYINFILIFVTWKLYDILWYIVLFIRFWADYFLMNSIFKIINQHTNISFTSPGTPYFYLTKISWSIRDLLFIYYYYSEQFFFVLYFFSLRYIIHRSHVHSSEDVV